MASDKNKLQFLLKLLIPLILLSSKCSANDILGCGGFVKSHVNLDYSKIEVGLYTKDGSLKEKTECAPTNGYYFLPLYEKGEYVLKVHPPAGWSFEPSQAELAVDGVTDKCSTGQDVNFSFNGFGITGRVITAGQTQGPSGINVQLVDDSGTVRNTISTVGGDFHFTPVIPGKYTLKASHPRWKLEPSQAVVQVKEGNTVLPMGVLTVKGYDVSGTITSFGTPISGVYVLLYSKEENPKFRVEGCNTALLQGVPDSPICHVKTDGSGEFAFGLVPAGEYRLMVLATAPGQVALTYNVKPQAVPFTVRHDSLFIKNAFEIMGFTIVGTVNSAPGKGLAEVRVLLDGEPVGKSDSAGKFTLANLHPGLYTVSFQHEDCEIPSVEVTVEATGPRRAVAATAGAWRVCGALTPPAARRVLLTGNSDRRQITVASGNDGSWCTFVPAGEYTAEVEVSERERRDGLQYHPARRAVAVRGATRGVSFSQLKAAVRGVVRCAAGRCAGLAVRLTARARGAPLALSAPVDADGRYEFAGVLPGPVDVAVPDDELCWKEPTQSLTVSEAVETVPPFEHVGYRLRIHSTHDVEVEYAAGAAAGVWRVRRGEDAMCAEHAAVYTLTPRGCHVFDPPRIVVDTSADRIEPVQIVAVSHACVVRVTAPSAAAVTLTLQRGGRTERTEPLEYTKDGGAYNYEHTLYLADGEECTVSAASDELLFTPAAAAVTGSGECQPAALTLRGRRALTLAGRLRPPVEGATVTLSADGAELQRVVTGADGAYRFGPLDAARAYAVAAHAESYVFGPPDAAGDVAAQRLAAIDVRLEDAADGAALAGALVSVSGGAYRRNALAGPDGRLRFAALQPAHYYVKPNMKEYRFTPQHHLLQVEDGNTHTLIIKGTRVSWSCSGRARSIAGAGVARVQLAARPRHARPAGADNVHCVQEEATTDEHGAFRIRGLLPECVYTLQLKETSTPELTGLTLVEAPAQIEVSARRDVSGVSCGVAWAAALTDGAVVVRAPPELLRTLSVSLAPAHDPARPVYAARLDAAPPAPSAPPARAAVLHALPRLPADNASYTLRLDSTLSRATHLYTDQTYHFNSDGRYKTFTFEFFPTARSSEVELRHTSLGAVPLAAALCALVAWRARVWAALSALRPARRPRAARADRAAHAERADLLDKASIDHILNTVNPPKKAKPKKIA